MNYGKLQEELRMRITEDVKEAIRTTAIRRKSSKSDLVRGYIRSGLAKDADATPPTFETELSRLISQLVGDLLTGPLGTPAPAPAPAEGEGESKPANPALSMLDGMHTPASPFWPRPTGQVGGLVTSWEDSDDG